MPPPDCESAAFEPRHDIRRDLSCSNVVFAQAPTYGQYFCFTDYVAGIGKLQSGQTVAGKITIPDKYMKFVLTYRAVDRDRFVRDLCKRSLDRYSSILSGEQASPDSLSL